MSNRLHGDDGNRGADDERVAARLTDEQLVQRLEDYRTESGESKSDVVRNALDEYLPDPNAETGHPEPDDPTLAKAYNVLRSRHDGFVMRQTAESVIAQEIGRAGLDAGAVWKEILKPLNKQGWVTTTSDSQFQNTYVKAIVPRQPAVSVSQGVAPADD